MKPIKSFTVLAAGLLVTITGCVSEKPELVGAVFTPKFSHPRDINNPMLPLASLNQDVLQSPAERVERTAKPDIKKTFTVAGHAIDSLAIEDKEFAGTNVSEITLDYFAQDDDGIVYYLGEDVDTYKDGQVSGHSGAWLLGRETQTPGIIMPAHPKVGDKFMSENVPHITWELDEVVSDSETVTVPAGTYSHCLKIKERASDGSTEYKYYAPGVGCVEESESDGDLPLQSHNAK